MAVNGKEIPQFLGDSIKEKADKWLKYRKVGIKLEDYGE